MFYLRTSWNSHVMASTISTTNICGILKIHIESLNHAISNFHSIGIVGDFLIGPVFLPPRLNAPWCNLPQLFSKYVTTRIRRRTNKFTTTNVVNKRYSAFQSSCSKLVDPFNYERATRFKLYSLRNR